MATNGPDLSVEVKKGEDGASVAARKINQPWVMNSILSFEGIGFVFGQDGAGFNLDEYLAARKAVIDQVVKDGDLAPMEELLTSQALAMDSMATMLQRRAMGNMGEYIDAAEKYFKLGMKAQQQSANAVAVLAKLKRGGVQTVKHIHVAEGGQAVVADDFHHHGGGVNANEHKRCHAKDVSSPPGPSLPGENQIRPDVPIPGGEGKEKVQNARRHKSGATKRKWKRLEAWGLQR